MPALRGEPQVRIVRPLGDAEVQHLEDLAGARVLRDEHVARLQVAVDDPVRVSGRDRARDLQAHTQHEFDRQRAMAFDAVVQILAAQTLHDHEADTVLFDPVEDIDDAGVADARRGARLLDQAFRGLRLDRLRQERLERDLPAQLDVLGLVHGAHPAPP